jgi:hypothetical protein
MKTVELIFPVKWVDGFSSRNPKLILIIFVLSLVLTWVDDTWITQRVQSNPFDIFFETKTYVEFFYTPFGKVVLLSISYFLYLYIILVVGKLKSKITFVRFVLPFKALCTIGIVFNVLEIILNIFGGIAPNELYWLFLMYIAVFYCILLVRVHRLKKLSSILLVFIPFLFLSLFFGTACIAPFLL